VKSLENFSLFIWNARSIHGSINFKKFQALMSKLSPDIAVVSESWFKNDHNYDLNGYTLVNVNRDEQNGGGLAIYAKIDCKLKVLKTVKEPYHKLTTEVKINGVNHKLIAIYRPPYSNNINVFMGDIEKELHTSNQPLLIVGDININIMKVEPLSAQFTQLLESYGAKIVNTNITRVSSGSLLDHCILRDVSSLHSVSTISNSMSDHEMIIAVFRCCKIKDEHSFVRHFTNYTSARQDFLTNLHTLAKPNDVNKQIEWFIEEINSVIQSNTQTATFKVKHNVAPWMNFKILKSIKHVENLHAKINKKEKEGKQVEKLKKKFNEAKLLLNEQIGRRYSAYMHDAFRNSNPRNTWRKINQLIGKNTKHESIQLIVDGRVVEDDLEIANLMNKYFQCVTNNNYSIHNFDACVENVKFNNNNFFLLPTDELEVAMIISNLKTLKSSGCDKITIKTLKELKNQISKPLAEIINNIFASGIYPDALKAALITPVLKKCDKLIVSSYRPISILPNIDKIIGKILLSRLEGFLIKFEYFDDSQHGFKKQMGTETALMEFNHFLMDSIDKKKIVLVISLDASHAFDLLPHDVLIAKLEKMGMRGIPLNLLISYLQNRTHATKINNRISSFLEVNGGVAQGSILGPFLFNTQLDDIKNLKLNSKIIRYADDINLVISCEANQINEAIVKLIEDVENIIEYHTRNGLLINAAKSNFVIFKKSSQQLPPHLEIKLQDGSIIEQAKSLKYLGCIFDNHLTMTEHIDYILKRINPIVSVLSRLKWSLPSNILLNIYYAHVHSHLLYAISIYGNASSENIKKLQVAQNRALKSVFKLQFDHPTQDIYTTLSGKVLPIKGLQVLSSLSFVFKLKRGLLKCNIPININTNQLRSNNNFIATSFSSNYGKYNFTHSMINIFNRLPADVKKTESFNYFKQSTIKLLTDNIANLLLCKRDILLHF
jgi:hypothetical protein